VTRHSPTLGNAKRFIPHHPVRVLRRGVDPDAAKSRVTRLSKTGYGIATDDQILNVLLA
jgi:hypothetical protein